MFDGITFRGADATVVWGYQTAVALKSWAVRKHTHPKTRQVSWKMVGTPARIDRVYARQTPLLLAVPRPGGHFLWPVVKIEHLGPSQIRAVLEPPEN
jgi:hypothetical protein